MADDEHQDFMFINHMGRHYRYQERNVYGVIVPFTNILLKFKKPRCELETIKYLENYLSKDMTEDLYFKIFKEKMPKKYTDCTVYSVLMGEEPIMLEQIRVNNGVMELFCTC